MKKPTDRRRPIVIDARDAFQSPHAPHRRVLDEQLELTRAIDRRASRRIVVEEKERDDVEKYVSDNRLIIPISTAAPEPDAFVVKIDRLYDKQRLRKAWREGADAERAVLWRLDSAERIDAAERELIHRRLYQPIGKYWAFGPAKALAEALAPTIVRPNAVTIAAAGSVLSASYLIAFGGNAPLVRASSAILLAIGLILDTADGRLARLQGTASEFGRFLDAMLDEFCDLTLHLAIAWSLFARDHTPIWLVLGAGYAIGKYLFMFASRLADERSERSKSSEKRKETSGGADRAQNESVGDASEASFWKNVVRLAGHADVRWHLWIFLAAIGGLGMELVVYTLYYPVRCLAGAIRREGAKP